MKTNKAATKLNSGMINEMLDIVESVGSKSKQSKIPQKNSDQIIEESLKEVIREMENLGARLVVQADDSNLKMVMLRDGRVVLSRPHCNEEITFGQSVTYYSHVLQFADSFTRGIAFYDWLNRVSERCAKADEAGKEFDAQ